MCAGIITNSACITHISLIDQNLWSLNISSAMISGGSNSGFETCTECIGFESLTEKDFHCSFAAHSPPPPPAVRIRREDPTCTKPYCKVFPPFLTSLCENGRPRFSLVKMRDNGRLEIAAVPNRGPEVLVVRDWEEGGHVRIRSLYDFI